MQNAGFFASLFQSKSGLPPFFRSLAVYLETQIIGIVLTGFMALSQYFQTSSHIDVQGLLTFLWASVAISVGKAFTGLVPQVQQAIELSATTLQVSPQPVVNNITVQHPAQAVVTPPVAPSTPAQSAAQLGGSFGQAANAVPQVPFPVITFGMPAVQPPVQA